MPRTPTKKTSVSAPVKRKQNAKAAVARKVPREEGSARKAKTSRQSSPARKAAEEAQGPESPSPYTRPALRERLKKEILAGVKGGKAGQWSARKAQLLAREYEKAGGGYRGTERSERQESLARWTQEEWRTRDGEPARKGGQDGEVARYLPDEAWRKLGESERRATDRKKRLASREGRRVVPNTPKARSAGREARRSP